MFSNTDLESHFIKELPFPIPRHSSQILINLPSSTFAHKADLIPLDISVPEILQFIQSSTRFPEEVTTFNGCDHLKSEASKAEIIDHLDKDDSIIDSSTGDGRFTFFYSIFH